MLPKVKVKGDCVEDDGAKRELSFYNGFDVMGGDDERALFSLRLLEGGVLEISSHSTARHGGKLLDDKLVVRPMDSGRITVGRMAYPDEQF